MKNKVRKGYYADRFKWALADFHYKKRPLSMPLYATVATGLLMGGVNISDNSFEFSPEYAHDVSVSDQNKATADIFQQQMLSLAEQAGDLEQAQLNVTSYSFDLDDRTELRKSNKELETKRQNFDQNLENYIVQMYGNTDLSEADFKTFQTKITSAGWFIDDFHVGDRLADVDAHSLLECQEKKFPKGKTLTKETSNGIETCMMKQSSEDFARSYNIGKSMAFFSIPALLLLLLGGFAFVASEHKILYGDKPKRKNYLKPSGN